MAGGILLEVGGPQQQGALVARESGKPCVLGIPDLLTRLETGVWVEVDGANGQVRWVSAPTGPNSAA